MNTFKMILPFGLQKLTAKDAGNTERWANTQDTKQSVQNVLMQ